MEHNITNDAIDLLTKNKNEDRYWGICENCENKNVLWIWNHEYKFWSYDEDLLCEQCKENLFQYTIN